MAKSGSVSSELTKRYALALTELAQENKTLTKVEGDVAALSALVAESEDFQFFIKSASIGAKQRLAVLADVAKQAKLQTETHNFLNVMSENGRLSALPEMLVAVKNLLAQQRGEVTAFVESAHALTATQQKAIAKELSDMTGKKVIVDASLNTELLGGMIVTVGSTRIDSSVSGRLERLKTAMNKRGVNNNIETLNQKKA